MGTISSQFCITSIVDGMTIHGSLWSDSTLTQYIDATGAVSPTWDTNTGPTIWLSVLRGSQWVSPFEYTWYYNGQEIDDDPEWASMFIKSEQLDEHGVLVPTLKIIRNLAAPGNRDLDVINIIGKIESNGVPVDFSAGIEVRVAVLSGSGYHADFFFPDGGTINDPGEHIRIIPRLYKDINELQPNFAGQTGQFTCEWYINYDSRVTYDTQQTAHSYYGKSKIKTTDTTERPCLWLYEGDVTDMTVIRCVFKDLNGNELFWLTQNVDDEQDPDMLYVMYDTGSLYDGKPASLHRGQTVNLKFWVATNVDPTNEIKNGRYSTYSLMLLRADGTTIKYQGNDWIELTATEKSIVIKEGQLGSITMQKANIPLEDKNMSGGTCTIGYEAVDGCDGKITGIIKAE